MTVHQTSNRHTKMIHDTSDIFLGYSPYIVQNSIQTFFLKTYYNSYNKPLTLTLTNPTYKGPGILFVCLTGTFLSFCTRHSKSKSRKSSYDSFLYNWLLGLSHSFTIDFIKSRPFVQYGGNAKLLLHRKLFRSCLWCVTPAFGRLRAGGNRHPPKNRKTRLRCKPLKRISRRRCY